VSFCFDIKNGTVPESAICRIYENACFPYHVVLAQHHIKELTFMLDCRARTYHATFQRAPVGSHMEYTAKFLAGNEVTLNVLLYDHTVCCTVA
jgi:hypothetical protein